MNDDDFWDEKEKKYIEKNEESRKKPIPFFLLILVTTVGVMFALGLSFSAINFLNGNETINTIISDIIGDDNKDKYLITYMESIGGNNNKGDTIIKDDFLHIVSAKVSDTKDGAKGEVVFFGGLMLTTKNTFSKKGSTVTYEVILKNDSSTDKTFEKLLFDPNGDVKYTISGIKEGDKIAPGQTAKAYITVEYNGKNNTKYPVTVESSVNISYRKPDKAIHIVDGKVSGTKNGGKGEIVYYEGLFMTTNNTFTSSSSQITYKITIKNDSDIPEVFSGIVYDPNGDVRYTVSGIKNGDILQPGQSVTAYVVVEPNGELKYPTTVESSMEYRFTTFKEVSNGDTIIKDDFLHIVSAKVSDTKDGAKGEVVFFGGLMLTTKNTFSKKGSTVTYEVDLKNDSSSDKTFEKLLFDTNGDVKYTISGIKTGDKIGPGQTVKAYITVEYNGKNNAKYPVTVESSVDISYRKSDKAIHIVDGKVNGEKNGGKGEIVYYEGLFLTTNNTFTSSSSQISYKITIKNDSDIPEAYSGIIYNPNGDVKYTISGINEGEILEPGQSVTAYVVVEPNGKLKYPTTIESSMEFRFTTFTVVDNENGINLLNQFPTSDEKGKLFEGVNYVYNFSLLVGKKTTGVYYEITAVPNTDNNLNQEYVKVYLEKNGKGVDLSFKENGKVKLYTDYKESTHEDAEGKVLYSGTISKEDANNGKIEFKLRMWISEDVKINENNMENYNSKKFGIRINTYAQTQR